MESKRVLFVALVKPDPPVDWSVLRWKMSKRSNCFSPSTALRYWPVDVGYRLTERYWVFCGGPVFFGARNVTFDPKPQGTTGIWSDVRVDEVFLLVGWDARRMDTIKQWCLAGGSNAICFNYIPKFQFICFPDLWGSINSTSRANSVMLAMSFDFPTCAEWDWNTYMNGYKYGKCQ